MKQDDPSKYWFWLTIANIYRYMIIIKQYFQGIIARFTKKRHDTKIFCIGFSKTGTTSIHHALDILGYRSLHWPRAHIDPEKGWINFFKKSKFDAFSDSPLYRPGFFKEIDKAFPNSKFILTIRNPESLTKSWSNYFSKSPWNIDDEKDKNRITKDYNDHKKDVIEYFKGKPSQLLIFDVFSGDSWEKLCKFIDKPIPDVEFPYKRKAKYKKK